MTTGLSGIVGRSLVDILQDAQMRRLMIRLAAEAIRVGKAQGYEIEPIRRLVPDVWLRPIAVIRRRPLRSMT